MTGLRCYRCNDAAADPGSTHIAQNCPTLARPRAHDKREHQARIDEYAEWYAEKKIDARQKWTLISDENRQWYGDKVPAGLTR